LPPDIIFRPFLIDELLEFDTSQLGEFLRPKLKAKTLEWVINEGIEGRSFFNLTFERLQGHIGIGEALKWEVLVKGKGMCQSFIVMLLIIGVIMA